MGHQLQMTEFALTRIMRFKDIGLIPMHTIPPSDN